MDKKDFLKKVSAFAPLLAGASGGSLRWRFFKRLYRARCMRWSSRSRWKRKNR